MSITVRLWSSEELKKVLDGDRWLTTLLANSKTLSEKMCETHDKVRQSIKHYQAGFAWQDEPFEEVTLYATDDEMLLKFIKEEYYIGQLMFLCEVKTEYRPVDIPQN